MHSAIESAQELARQGFAVIPIHSVVGDLCGCGNLNCKSPGKHPKTKNWPNHWVRYEEQAHKFFRPADNIGILTGKPSKVIVIDVDPRNGGEESLVQLQQKFDVFTDRTLVAETGGGGKHFYFRSENNRIKNSFGTILGDGIDVKGQRGFVVAPPSLHASGERYLWETDPSIIQDLPSDLEEILLSDLQRTTNPRNSPSKFWTGERNVNLARIAGGLRRKGSSKDQLLDSLIKINVEKCIPPLSKPELEKIAKSISRYPILSGAEQSFPGYWRSLILSEAGEGLNATARSVMCSLAELTDEHGTNCTPPLELIALKAGCSVPTTHKAIKIAQSLGWIHKLTLTKTNGERGSYCSYSITMPWNRKS